MERPPALKVTIQEILQGSIKQEDPNQPWYVLTLSGEKAYRASLMATVLNIEKVGSIGNVVIDDGSGRIIVRFFEETPLFFMLAIGKCFLIIGKARVYNEEKYISPEIMKEISPLWLRHRALELSLRIAHPKNITEPVEEEKIEGELAIVESALFPSQRILGLIKELDQGRGVLIEEIVHKSTLKETEQLLQNMLEKGEIFQIAPGRIKTL